MRPRGVALRRPRRTAARPGGVERRRAQPPAGLVAVAGAGDAPGSGGGNGNGNGEAWGGFTPRATATVRPAGAPASPSSTGPQIAN